MGFRGAREVWGLRMMTHTDVCIILLDTGLLFTRFGGILYEEKDCAAACPRENRQNTLNLNYNSFFLLCQEFSEVFHINVQQPL
jgi:hypothetical protein